jgi:hypothetical protein
MKSFLDRDGRSWQIDLNIGNVFRVRSASDGRYDLLDPTHDVAGQPLQVVLATDLVQFWELLWLLVEVQAGRSDTDATAFGQAMTAECLLLAQASFFDEWRDFFRSLHRPDAALAVESQAKVQAAALRLVTAKIKEIDQTKLERKMTVTIERAVNAAYGSVQASLDAILDPTPGENSN